MIARRTAVANNEKLSWDEMKRRFPNEFVAIVDPEHDAEDQLTGGTVVGHGKNKHELLDFLGTLGAKHIACRWTGAIHGRVRLVRLADEK
jgi:hypothetical protein